MSDRPDKGGHDEDQTDDDADPAEIGQRRSLPAWAKCAIRSAWPAGPGRD